MCTSQLAFGFHPSRDIVATFDAARSSSDGGLLLVRAADERLGVSAALAALMPDERDGRFVRHTRLEQIRQRLYQICLGYEDCNDADALRIDPVLKTVCDLLPDTDDALSSQPTLSRFENAIDGRALNRMRDWFEQSYVDSLDPSTEVVVLDIDSTDDETHGSQQLSFFHGFYDQHMFHPLLVFDAQSGQLASVLLRPGNAHAARGAGTVLERLIRGIRRRLPRAQIVVRADSGFCMPRISERLEKLDREIGDVDYIIGIAKNARLLKLAATAMAEAKSIYAERKHTVRHFSSLAYAADTWPVIRHVVLKAEHSSYGENPRFVVTTLRSFDPQHIYDVGYCARGQCENFIKDLKNALQADRLSCSSFKANALRLLLYSAAYRLMHAVRQAAKDVGSQLGAMQLDTLRLRLLKVAATVTESARRIVLRLPSAFPFAHAFAAIAAKLAPASSA
ncbi:MAG: IS1380 family transposase [Deltaproteobacteria bacterium]|nr:IS1380 family transposase [Deltaproteobacteria bacterium]